MAGKIADKADNQPIPGVSVLIKGTSTGTISQADGSFKLQINQTYLEKVTLIFSFIGYETIEKEVNFKNSSEVELQEINLKLDAQMLGEVVYVGQASSCWYQPRNVWWRVKNLFR